ncbi:nucleotidyltransferase domain protein [archaeon]|nr:nucleotidyltransferase domain protein [archaeon]
MDRELPQKIEKTLKEFVNMVMEKYEDRVEKIILFGSYARGEGKEESDIDVLVITTTDRFEMQKNLSEIAVDVLLEMGVYISAKGVTVEEYEQMKNINTGFYQNIAREGVTVE